MKTIAIFRSNSAQSMTNEIINEERPPGKWVAELLRSRLQSIGVNVGVPVEATEGWEFEAKIENICCLCFVNWVPIGTPAVDFWAIQTRQKLGLFRSAFWGRRAANKDIGIVLERIDTALAMLPEFLDIQWLDAGEFAEMY